MGKSRRHDLIAGTLVRYSTKVVKRKRSRNGIEAGRWEGADQEGDGRRRLAFLRSYLPRPFRWHGRMGSSPGKNVNSPGSLWSPSLAVVILRMRARSNAGAGCLMFIVTARSSLVVKDRWMDTVCIFMTGGRVSRSCQISTYEGRLIEMESIL